MRYNSKIHHRRSIRLKGYDYSQAGLYFVTICVRDREHLFGEIINGEMVLNEYGKIVNAEWQYLKTKYPHIELHGYVIMPNHFHGIIQISETSVGAGFARPICKHLSQFPLGRADPAPTATIGNIIGYFKYQTTKKINLSIKIWQRNYYEHIIRNNRSYKYIANYIINNPINWENDNFFYHAGAGKPHPYKYQ
ncbi:MAG: hypothetical protein FWE63_04395 [Bacteroidales bacterium]|nr:hypothetical protein [Bacteroidales bacterium]